MLEGKVSLRHEFLAVDLGGVLVSCGECLSSVKYLRNSRREWSR